MKTFQFFILVAFFGLLVSVVHELPPKGSHDAPIHQTVSPVGSPVAGSYFIENAYRHTHTDNIVTVVLADYRAFDTFGETVVVFTAGAAVILILRRRKES